ncbi:MAG: hypothetical protein ACOY0T_27810 [Myxococcota bacterium]
MESQQAQADGRLLLARQDAAICTNRLCPAALVADCAAWLEELEQRIPSIVFDVRVDGVVDNSATIEVDGQLVKEWSRGQALPLNPGEHEVKISHVAHPSVVQKVLLADGMRFRLVSVDIRSTDGAAGRPEVEQPSSLPSQSATPRPIPVLVYPLAGLGVIALGGFVGFTLSGNAEYDRLQRSCAPFCSDDQVSGVQRRYLVGDISLGVSALSIAGAAILYLTRPTRPSPPVVGVAPVRNGAVAVFSCSVN